MTATPGQALHARYVDAMDSQGVGIDDWDVLDEHDHIAWEAIALPPLPEKWAAAREPHAAPEPEARIAPCPVDTHDGDHIQLRTGEHWLCAIMLTGMLVSLDVIADPAPDVTKLRAELDEEQGYRSELTNDILLNAPESFDGDEAADVIAVRYVRHLEAEIAEHAEPKHAPELAAGLLDPLHALAAKWDSTAARNQRNGQSLLDQGDEYGSEGLAIAEALGDCVIDLRAVLADAPPAQAAPADRDDLAARADNLRAVLTAVLAWFGNNGSGHYARVSGLVLARAYRDAGLPLPDSLSHLAGQL